MKSLTIGHIKTGYDSVRGAKMRSFWTMFGIIVGVASVITVVGIGEGVKLQISSQIHHFDKDLIVIQPLKNSSPVQIKNSLFSNLNYGGSLSDKDLNAIIKTEGVVASAPLSSVSGSVKADNGVYSGGSVIGTTTDLSALLNQSLAYGVFLSDQDIGNNIAVLGQEAAAKMFNDAVPLGRTFSFRGKDFIVHGIFIKPIGRF